MVYIDCDYIRSGPNVVAGTFSSTTSSAGSAMADPKSLLLQCIESFMKLLRLLVKMVFDLKSLGDTDMMFVRTFEPMDFLHHADS